MLLPLLMAVGLWLHITRVARARFLPTRAMMGWTTLGFVVLSLVLPAATGAPAAMSQKAAAFPIDAWYAAPLWLTDRLAGGWLWLFWFVAGTALGSVLWLLPRRAVRAAAVESSRCHSCTKCSVDCPYLAITMVPRTDGRNFAQQAQVDPKFCVGSGICARSCDTAGVGLPWLPARDERDRLDELVTASVARGEA